MSKYIICFSALLIAILSSCTAPRDILVSGKTTPKGQLRIGGSYSGNISTLAFKALDRADLADATINAISQKDTVHFDAVLKNIASAITAYSFDPVGVNFGLYARYGLFRNMDIGYRYVKGAHVFNTMYQFMGADTINKKHLYGSAGLQYSRQSANILKQLYLDKIDFLLNYTFSRQDIMIPIVFSKSFGADEKYGSIGWGAVYNFSWIKYGYSPHKLYTNTIGSTTPLPSFEHTAKYSSYGIFGNIKGGYRQVYAIFSLAMYYQKITPVYLLNGEQTSFSGITFVPSLAVQVHLNTRRKKK